MKRGGQRTALRLARFFGTGAQFWFNLQASYDLDVAREALGDRLHLAVQPVAERCGDQG